MSDSYLPGMYRRLDLGAHVYVSLDMDCKSLLLITHIRSRCPLPFSTRCRHDEEAGRDGYAGVTLG